MRLSGKIGLALVFLGVVLYVSARYWMATRTLVALDMPISLSKGHISGEFKINLDSDYFIQIEVEKKGGIQNLECLMWGCYDTPAILKARWLLSDANGRELAGDSSESNGSSGSIGVVGRVIGHFKSSGGRGKLDVEILSDTKALDVDNPRLKIEASGTGYNLVSRVYERSILITGILVFIGASLLFLSLGARRAEHSPSTEVAAARGAVVHGLPLLRRFPQKALVSGLPSFALLASFVLLLVLVPFWLLEFWKPPAQGIWISTYRPATSSGTSMEPVIVSIDRNSRWFLNDQPIPDGEFRSALIAALRRRPDWTVYLDADPDLSFQVPASAMDTIHDLGGRTILVTPTTRQSCCRSATSH